MKNKMLCALLVLPLALSLSACSSVTSSLPLLLEAGGLLTDACFVGGRPQVVSVGVTAGKLDVTYYRHDATLTYALFDTSAAPFLASLPATVSFPVTPPTHCD